MAILSLIPITYYRITEFFILDKISFTLAFLRIWVVVFILITTPLIYKSIKNNHFYYFLIFSFLRVSFLRFLTNNLLFFYFIFEVSLIPTILLIIGWGYQIERIQSLFYFIMYTIFASLPLLTFITRLSLENEVFYRLNKSFYRFKSFTQELVFGFVILLAFLVKIPLYIFHLWLPKAHVEAPVGGSIILAAVLLKLGGYGIFRTIFFYFKINFYLYFLVWVSCAGIVVRRRVCSKINDIKSLIAYSSVAHIAIALLGIYSIFKTGSLGCLILLLRHGICSSGIFYFIGITYNLSRSRTIIVNKGITNFIKTYTLIIFLIFIPNIAIPLTINLFSEIYILLNIVLFRVIPLVIILIGIFLVAYFTLLLFRRMTHGIIFYFSKINGVIKFDSLLLCFTHIFVLNISFLFINILYLFILFKIIACGALKDYKVSR